MDKNRFAPLPPMGWNSYDSYDTTVDEAAVRANADVMAEKLAPYGWRYVVVDIQWYAPDAGSRRGEFQYIPFSPLVMDQWSRLLPDPARFPSSVGGAGFAPLAAYVHKRGLLFGIHIMRGVPRQAAHAHTPIYGVHACAADIADPSSICGWNPDMYGVRDVAAGQAYYDSLLSLYAQWGVDYIKCDDICNTNLYPNKPNSGFPEIAMLAKAIERCKRPIVLSLSPGPALLECAQTYRKYANMWRITDDFWDRWDLLKDMFARCARWQEYVSPGCWPDCDMLPLGRLGKGFGKERTTRLTSEEQQTMMTLWCVFHSPLMLGAELTKLDDATLSLLTNRHVLALLHPRYESREVLRDEDSAVWISRDPAAGEVYVALFNLGDAPRTVWADKIACSAQDRHSALDLWSEERFVLPGDNLAAHLRPHACALWQLLS